MRVQENITDSSEVRVLKETELDAVAGGYIISTVDVSEMPDRIVSGECGTMWWQRKIIMLGR
jgi:hypothetical protein